MAAHKPFSRKEYHTRFDNYLLDEIMPNSPPNAWKILCFVVRKTLGWIDPNTGERKSRDRLSYSQIMKGTGIKHPKTVSTALKFLVQAQYLLAFGSQEEWEANEYELNTEYEVEAEPTSKIEPTSKNEVAPTSKNEAESTSKNEDTNSKFFKRNYETETNSHVEKSNVDFSRGTPSETPQQSSLLPLDNSSNPPANTNRSQQGKRERAKKQANPNTKPILDAYKAAYEKENGFPYTFPGSDTKAAKVLADAGYTPEQVVTVYEYLCKDEWWKERNNISLLNISKNIGGILKKLNYNGSGSPPVQKIRCLDIENLYS